MERSKSIVLVISLLVANTDCSAHGFGGNGMLHPLTGLDHMLAMVAIGVWSAQLGGKAVYLIPCFFLTMMLIGGIVSIEMISFNKIEIAIPFSVVFLGLAITINKRISLLLAGLAVGAFGFCHGFSHGTEIPKATSEAGYIAGFLITTFALHVVGAVGGLLILEGKSGLIILRILGAFAVISGGLLFFK